MLKIIGVSAKNVHFKGLSVLWEPLFLFVQQFRLHTFQDSELAIFIARVKMFTVVSLKYLFSIA